MHDFTQTMIDHESRVAYYAGRLPASRQAAVRRWLDAHPPQAQQAREDARHELAVAQQYESVLAEPVPSRLQAVMAVATPRVWTRRVAMVAVIVIAGSGGWWLGDMQHAVTGSNAAGDFVDRVAAVAGQDDVQRTPVVLDQTTMQAPDLSGQGYRLIGRHAVHAGADDDMAVFVYRDHAGDTARIYAENEHPDTPAGSQVISRNGVSLVQWRQGGKRYALVGNDNQGQLLSLAQVAQATTTGPEQSRQLASQGEWVHSASDQADSSEGRGQGVMPAAVDTADALQPNPM